MSTLETRIAEVLAAHDFRIKEEIGAHVGVKTIVCNCGNRYGLGESHRAHQAAALAPVIREREAEAWDKGWDAGNDHGYDAYQVERGYVPIERAENTNPYRSNDDHR